MRSKTGICQPYEYRAVTKSGKIKRILETIISIRHQGERSRSGILWILPKASGWKRNRTGKRKTYYPGEKTRGTTAPERYPDRDAAYAPSLLKMEETAPIIMGSMKKLFPASQGALFLLSNSRSDLESAVGWGDFPTNSDANIFSPDACWGLRRGRAHVVEDVDVGPNCPHLIHTVSAPYVCLPLMAKGDILGLLHLKNAFSPNGTGSQEIADLKQMAVTLSEYLSLSIANVKLSESLARQSIQDTQSGLYNRRFMEESLQREILRAERKKTPIGIIMGDLDHFKKFNDDYGHAAGDKIITQVGRVLKDKFRGSDIACRYGGEEFLIILPVNLAGGYV